MVLAHKFYVEVLLCQDSRCSRIDVNILECQRATCTCVERYLAVAQDVVLVDVEHLCSGNEEVVGDGCLLARCHQEGCPAFRVMDVGLAGSDDCGGAFLQHGYLARRSIHCGDGLVGTLVGDCQIARRLQQLGSRYRCAHAGRHNILGELQARQVLLVDGAHSDVVGRHVYIAISPSGRVVPP